MSFDLLNIVESVSIKSKLVFRWVNENQVVSLFIWHIDIVSLEGKFVLILPLG